MAIPPNSEDIEEWLRRKFPKMNRKFRSPSLTTFNGIGPRFVGERDFDHETSSWVTTQYFCVLFVPIFAMAAYRVASSQGGGWNLLGKEPISSRARKLNVGVLLLLALAIGGGWWNAYTSSPQYRATKALEVAGETRVSGAPDKAMALYEDILTNPELPRKDEARAGYSSCFDESLKQLPLPKKEAAIRAALISRNFKPAPVPDLANRVLNYIEQAKDADPAESAALLKAALPAVEASGAQAYRTAWRGYLQNAVSANPENAAPAIDLAVILDAEDKPDECRKLLSPHAAKLGTTEGARVLGQILVRDAKFSEGAPLLKAYSASRLSALHAAEEKYEAVIKRVQKQAITKLETNHGPKEFYRKYEAANEAGKRELVEDFVGLYMKDSKEIAAAVAELEAASPVVPVMLSLGIAQLNLAQGSPDMESRKKSLEDAESSFLSVRKSASGTDEYQLFLGQVSYWLGKHEEGKKLFAQFMTAKGESAEKQCMVSVVLRQLGALDESRGLSEKAFAAAKDDQLRQRAADLRASTFIDNDDRIAWLKRAGNGKEIQIALNEAMGHKKRQEGDRAAAEELYRKALAGYDELPRSASVLNNSANILSSLYELTRDPKFFKDAVNRHEESSRLAGQDTVLMNNLLSDWSTLLAIEAAESIKEIDLRVLPTSGIGVLVQMRHKSAGEEKQLIETYLKSEAFRKARSTSNQLLVLAPKNPGSYSSAQSLAMLAEDTATLKSLRDRAAAANFEHRAAWEQAGKYWKGEKDSDFRKQLRASLTEWLDASKTLPKTAPTLSRLACRINVYNLQVALSRFGETFDSKVLLSQATEIATEQPSYANLRIAQSACLAALLDELATKNVEFAKWMHPLQRILDYRDILILAIERKLQSNEVKDHPHFKAWLAWREKILAAYPNKHRAEDWALLRCVDSVLADEERLAAEKETMLLLDSELDWLIDPTNPNHVLSMVWQEQMLNRPDHAAAILKDAISRGMPLPEK